MDLEKLALWPENEGPYSSRRWGPHFWRFLHIYVALNPGGWNKDTRLCVVSLLRTLPCEVCRQHAVEYLAQNPIETSNASNEGSGRENSPSQWVLNLHNHVAANHSESKQMPWSFEKVQSAVICWLMLPGESLTMKKSRGDLPELDRVGASERLDAIEEMLLDISPPPPPLVLRQTKTRAYKQRPKLSFSLMYTLFKQHDVRTRELSNSKKQRLSEFRFMWKSMPHSWDQVWSERWPRLYTTCMYA